MRRKWSFVPFVAALVLLNLRAVPLDVTDSRKVTPASGDRKSLPSGVVSPAGSATATMTVTPIHDAITEPNENGDRQPEGECGLHGTEPG